VTDGQGERPAEPGAPGEPEDQAGPGSGPSAGPTEPGPPANEPEDRAGPGGGPPSEPGGGPPSEPAGPGAPGGEPADQAGPGSGPSARPVTASGAPEAAPKKPGITIGGLAKPGGGPRSVIMRIGLILVAALILATIGVGGYTVISHLTGKGTPNVSATATPTPSASAEPYYTYNDSKNQFSIDVPTDWSQRIQTASPNPNIYLLVGPPAPYPNEDYVAVGIFRLPQVLNAGDMIPFKTYIVNNFLTADANIASQNPVTSRNLAGWAFVWSAPSAKPTVISGAYFLMDGDRMIVVELQVQPATDTQSFLSLTPIWNHMAASLTSFYPIPSSGGTPSTSSPAASPSH
jgi:hypothetical protein